MTKYQTRLTLLLLCTTVAANATAILQGTVSFLNSGSRPAAGVKISAFGANDCYTSDAGMFRLEFSNKKPGDKVKIIIGSSDNAGISIELVNDKVVDQVRIPSRPDDDLVEIIVCKVGQRNDAAIRYNGLIVKTINESVDRRIKEINEKLDASKIDAETIISLQNEKEKLTADRDSALVKAEEQALYIASINLDKASNLVKEAISKVDKLQDIPGAIAVLDNEMLYQAYLEASEKKKKADSEIQQVISGFEFKIKLLEPVYRYGEIAECYEQIINIYNKEDLDKLKRTEYEDAAALNWGLNGTYQKQLEMSLKVLSTKELFLSPEHPDFVETFSNIAKAYLNIGDYKNALLYNSKALECYEKFNVGDLSELYSSLASTYVKTGDYNKALEYNLSALAVMEKVLPPDDPKIATVYNNIAHTYGEKGENRKQLEFNLKALEIREKTLPADHPILAQSYNNLAFTYGNVNNLDKSLEYNQKALAIREKVLPAKHPSIAQSYTNIALTYSKMGEYQKAVDANLKAVEIREKVLTPYNPLLGLSYNNLAFSYGRMAEFHKSLEYHLKALYIREKSLPAGHIDIAGSYSNIGLTYNGLNDFQKSLDNHIKALEMRQTILPANDPLMAVSFNNVGAAYREVGAFDLAIDNQLQAIKIGEALNPYHQDLHIFYINLGFTYLKMSCMADAYDAFKKSESIKSDPRIFRGWAMYHALRNEKPEAIQFLTKALDAGMKNLKWLETDPSLESIRSEAGYNALVERLKK